MNIPKELRSNIEEGIEEIGFTHKLPWAPVKPPLHEDYYPELEVALWQEAMVFPISRFLTSSGAINNRRLNQLNPDFKQDALNLIFIKRAYAVHGDRYGYAKVEYASSNQFVTIICKEHGPFKQYPSVHLRGSGCQKCAQNSRDQHRIRGNNLDLVIVDDLGVE